MKSAQYSQPLVQDTSRGPSMSIWGDLNALGWYEVQGSNNALDGQAPYMFVDDFIGCPFPALNAQACFGQWSCFADTGSTFTDAGEEGGVVKLNNGTAGKAVILSSAASAFSMISGATNNPYFGGKLYFECRVAMGAISGATEGYFIGLADQTSSQITSANSTILATTANSYTGTKGLFGFGRIESAPTDWSVTYQVAGGSTVNPTGLSTLVTTVTGTAPTAYAAVSNGNGTGFVKLGFIFDPSGSCPTGIVTTASGDGTVAQTVGQTLKQAIRFYVNGQLCSVFLDSTIVKTARFPAKRMAPVICFMDASGGGGSSTGLWIDWIRVAQLPLI